MPVPWSLAARPLAIRRLSAALEAPYTVKLVPCGPSVNGGPGNCGRLVTRQGDSDGEKQCRPTKPGTPRPGGEPDLGAGVSRGLGNGTGPVAPLPGLLRAVTWLAR